MPPRLTEIPSIAEVVHPVEDSAPVSSSSFQSGVDDSQVSIVRRPVRRSSAPTLSPPPQQQQHEEDHKKHHHHHRHHHNTGRSTEVSVDIDSKAEQQSKRGDHHKRRPKKPRGAEALGLDDFMASGAGGMPRSQSFPDALVPRSPQKARHRPPPPYKPQTLGDMLSSSRGQPDDSTKSAGTPPPPFDPDARWDWDKEGVEEGGGPRDSFDISNREGRVSFGATEGTLVMDDDEESGAAASRVVTVDVYRSQGGVEVPDIEAEEYSIAMVATKTKERGRRRESHRRRSDGGGIGLDGGGIEGRERREDGSSPVPLVEIVTSSPSVSPTRPEEEGQTSPLLSPEGQTSSGMFPHSPIQMASSSIVHPPQLPPSNAGLGVFMSGKGVTISEKGGDGNRDSVFGGRGGEIETNEWPWEGYSTQAGTSTATGGGRKKESTAAAAAGVAGGLNVESKLTALPANSLMLAADSLGNIRIYATEEVLGALSKSAFCAPRTP